MKKSILKIISLLIILILYLSIIPTTKSLSASYAYIYAGVTNYYSRAFETLNLINQERAKQGLGALTMDESLLESAMLRSAETTMYFSHTRPDGTICFTVNSKAHAENIAYGYPEFTPAQAVNGWMNSEGHRENILTSGFKSTGIGCVYINGVWCYTQIFSYDAASQSGVSKADEYKVRPFRVIDSLIEIKHNIPSSIVLGSSLSMEATGYTITTASPSFIGIDIRLDPRSFVWYTSDPDVVKVDQSGTITGGSFGTATITGRIGSKSISYNVTVNLPFKDVHESDYYYDSVVYAFLNKIIKGTSLTKFSPNDNITRGQLVTILHRIEKYPKAGANAKKFSDVKSGPYYDAIMWASSKGIVSGYSNGNFGPNNKVTRAQLATILWNYAKYKKINVSKKADISTYKDYNDTKKKTSYAIEALSWAVGNKVMSGTQDGKLNSTGSATRGQAAVMITNYLKNIKR